MSQKETKRIRTELLPKFSNSNEKDSLLKFWLLSHLHLFPQHFQPSVLFFGFPISQTVASWRAIIFFEGGGMNDRSEEEEEKKYEVDIIKWGAFNEGGMM